MEKIVYREYLEAKPLLEDGDILLFRGTGFISNLIKIAGAGQYSHVAIASKVNDHWEAVEFREWYGGRSINLKNYIESSEKSKTKIDVYRSDPFYTTVIFNEKTNDFDYLKKKFVPKDVTTCMREYTGLPYSYRRIWLILKIKLFKWKILTNSDILTKNLPTKEIIFPVCSTILSHCFSKNGYPLLNNKSDEYIEPSHISLSSRLNYLFTLTIDNPV